MSDKIQLYANFKHFEEDTQVLVDRINTQPEFIRAGYYTEGDSIQSLATSFYAQLTQTQKTAVLKQIELDFDFYYHLFPQDRRKAFTTLSLDLTQILQILYH